MKPYADKDHDSSVRAYEYDDTSISIQFSDKSVYKYSYARAGATNVETMKRLADSGDGLNSYIIRHVKTLFDR
jgi:hypothetical protein